MQGRTFAYKKVKILQTHKGKNTTYGILHTKVWQQKIILFHKIFSSPIHKRDKSLNISKKEVRN
jgi:hypothetical protein